MMPFILFKGVGCNLREADILLGAAESPLHWTHHLDFYSIKLLKPFGTLVHLLKQSVFDLTIYEQFE
jgi:hypothetical protein